MWAHGWGGHIAAFGVLADHAMWDLVASAGLVVVWGANHFRFAR